MFFHSRTWLGVLLLCLCTWQFPGSIVQAQGGAGYTLEVVGGELENFVIAIRYYRGRQLAKSVASRVTLVEGRYMDAIESQHDAVEVIIQANTFPLTATIGDGKKVIDQKKLDAPGAFKLTVGRPGRTPYQPVPIELSDKESKLVEALQNAYGDETSAIALVSKTEQATVDGASLDVFLRALKSLLGNLNPNVNATDGWIGWNTQQGSRVLAGVLKAERGPCGLRLTLKDDKISEITVNCPGLSDDYFSEPVDVEDYVRQAKSLTRYLFEGNAVKAHQLYSPRFQQQVTQEQLKQLSDTLHQRYGTKIKSQELKRYTLSPYDFSQKSNLLNLDLLVELDTGARCISRTVFNIPSGKFLVGKAHLGGINIQQVFPSSHPALSTATEKLLTDLGVGIPASQLIERLPPDVRPSANTEKLQATLDRLKAHLAGLSPQIDFDLWHVENDEDRVLASGPVYFGSLEHLAEMHFVGDLFEGFSLYGPSVAESTLGAIDFEPAARQAAERFWNHVLKHEADAAYALLAPEFQQEFPLAELKSQLEAQQQQDQLKLKSLKVDDVRMASNVLRPTTSVMATVFLIATFDDSSELALACELAKPIGKDWSVFDFSNDFQLHYPVESIPIAQSEKDGALVVVDALLSGDGEALTQLIAPESRPAIDASALAAYLKQLQSIIGATPTGPKSLARIVEYQAGDKSYRCNTALTNQNGEAMPLEIWFRRGHLERFAISDSMMTDFVGLIEDTSTLEQRIQTFVRSWFDDPNTVRPYLHPSIGVDAQIATLGVLNGQFAQEHGKLMEVSIANKRPYRGDGGLEFEVTLKGDRSSKTVVIRTELGAFGGLISGVNF